MKLWKGIKQGKCGERNKHGVETEHEIERGAKHAKVGEENWSRTNWEQVWERGRADEGTWGGSHQGFHTANEPSSKGLAAPCPEMSSSLHREVALWGDSSRFPNQQSPAPTHGRTAQARGRTLEHSPYSHLIVRTGQTGAGRYVGVETQLEEQTHPALARGRCHFEE